jgi:NitT/TauT family transport system permease protein
MASRRTFPTRSTLERLPFGPVDVLVLAALVGLLYAAVEVGGGVTASFRPGAGTARIDMSATELPYYAARSLLRMFAALGLSFVFALVYAYVAAKSRRAGRVLIPLLDVLQSVPVLGFLSVTVTAFIGLFPGSVLGLECAAVFAIFTSQAWNMAFSFYASLTSLPRELDEASRMLQLTHWQRFCKLELAGGAIDLIWNGMMSFGGGWFFLVASEAISVLNHSYQLPGVGSYAANAIAEGDNRRIALALITMVAMVVGVNVLFWRPLVAWSERFKLEDAEAAEQQRSLVLTLLRRSALPGLLRRMTRPVGEATNRALAVLGRDGGLAAPTSPARRRAGDVAFAAALAVPLGYGLWRAYGTVEHGPGLGEVGHAAWLGAITLARVLIVVVVGSVVWVPVGVWIGSHPRVTRLAQPVVQVLASFPANFLFPFATIAFLHYGISLDVGGIVLMSLGAQWYILFNTIAGAIAIPTDLREAMAMLDVRGWQRWRRLVLPAILPAYVTGAITASGGAWNAAIVAEVVTYSRHTLTATGLGAYIAHATEDGDSARIVIGIAVMSAYVVGINRLVWRRLYRVSQSRYQLG